jgi:hypothetical protein
MNYWLTTHWPPRIDDHDHSPGGVWVVEGKQTIIGNVQSGDLVWIYESGSGKTVIREQANGTSQRVPCKQGRQGVIALCRITAPAFAREDATPERYVDGRTMWWRWYAPTVALNTTGFVPRRETAILLGYSPDYLFRGFGTGSSGLKGVTESQHHALLQAFRGSAGLKQKRRLEQITYPGHGQGGEGRIHKELKEAIAANPAELLGEEGLSLARLEYSFPTGDRIDVLLLDQYGRYVAVEVEPACDESEICGPLQCMKYRAMLSYFVGAPIQEIRAILASPEIHSEVRDRCSKHGVETVITGKTRLLNPL